VLTFVIVIPVYTGAQRAPAHWRSESLRRGLALAGSLALVLVIAVADHATGYEVRLAILNLVPIALATWRAGTLAGAGVSLAAALGWIWAFESAHPYSHRFYLYWEGGITAASFLLFALLLARLKRALERSDERFVTVLEGLQAAVLAEDARTGALLYANGPFREQFGARRPPSQDSGEFYDERARRWYLVQSRRLRWTDGRDAALRVYSDITEERTARELIARHRDAVHRSARLVALGEFASAIAHELSQPLAAIATYNNTSLRLLQAGASDPAQLAEAMQKCRDQAKRAGAIIQRLREVLRHPAPALAALDLNEVAHAALELAELEALQGGVALELKVAPVLPTVRADRLLIEQVALNLVRNAIEAVQALPPEQRRVTVATAPAAGGALLAVSDLGDGVPAEACERLFDAFVTTKPGGLGLGLSICRSVIEAHGGSIQYEQNGAQGARFSFTLPAAQP
jgi:C4-dicarboxylate-specific signal transduction histidine kinase